MWFDSVIKGRQSVTRSLVRVPYLFVFLFAAAKIGQTAVDISSALVYTQSMQTIPRMFVRLLGQHDPQAIRSSASE